MQKIVLIIKTRLIGFYTVTILYFDVQNCIRMMLLCNVQCWETYLDDSDETKKESEKGMALLSVTSGSTQKCTEL